MKSLKIASAIVALGVIISPLSANATDIYHPDPPEVVGSSVNWNGVYFGGRLGYGNANHDLSLHEFFKDYCADDDDLSVGFDEDGNFDPDGFKTVENKKKLYGPITGDTCETLAKEGKFDAGSHVTVPGDSQELASLDGLNSRGVVGGFQVGADRQYNRWVFGAFGSYDFAAMDTEASFGGTTIKLIEKGDEWSAGIRAGRLLSPETLLYGLVAYTQTDYDFSGLDEDGSRTVTFDGVTFGGGIEHALTSNVFVGIEGTHTIYGEETIFEEYDAALNTGSRLNDKINETKVMGTLKFKLNKDLF